MHMEETLRSQHGRLTVYFEQDLAVDAAVTEQLELTERLEQHCSDADYSFLDNSTVDSNNNDNNNNDSIELNERQTESSECNTVTPPEPVVRRRKNTARPNSRSRERSFVYAAGGAVVGGARSVARTFKRMSLIESSSSSSARERVLRESNIQDGVESLKTKQHYNSTPSLPQSYASSSAVPLQLSGSAHSLSSSPSPSPRSSQSHKSNSNPNQGQGNGLTAGKGSNTAKQHEQQASALAAISSTSAAAGAAANVAATSAAAAAAAANATPPEKEKDKEKEKKRKEVSSSRVKKFHRHFSQVSKDEKLINYFSCALVGDIPLQGHLYITEEHFAFYSNVFGYVTKVVIPTSSVTKISKEKTAKIIPNAVGVATADERYVFGSFISRESAFRLMCTVCIQLANGTEILPKPLPVDMELTEEYLLDDDSSCSISGNESPPQLRDATAAAAANSASTSAAGNAELRQRNIAERHSDVLAKSKLDVSLDQMIIRSSAPPVVHYEDSALAAASVLILNGAGANLSNSTSANASAASSSGPASSSSSPITVVGVSVGVGVSGTPATTTTAPRSRLGGLMHSARSHLSLRLPTLTELHVLYLGIMLAIMLALFSVFLLYRILDIEAKTSLYNTPIDFHLRSGNDEDIFAEALRWQKELQDKSTAEAQHILSKNLEQISKVRRSLETLSMLIHDRRAGYAQSENIREAEAELDPSQISVSSDISV